MGRKGDLKSLSALKRVTVSLQSNYSKATLTNCHCSFFMLNNKLQAPTARDASCIILMQFCEFCDSILPVFNY